MKKIFIWLILSLIIILILISNFLYHIFYFKSFHKNVRMLDNSEKEKIIDILNKNINLEGYNIKFENVYKFGENEFVKIELSKENSKKHYYINVNTLEIVRG
jgi:uncharacterized protein YxeA